MSSSPESELPPHLELSPSQKSLVKAWWRKASTNVKSQGANRYEKQGAVFGIPLMESLRYAHSRISYLDERTNHQRNAVIPTIVAKCGAFLKEKALHTEGIFRLSGNAKRISMLQAVFDTPSGDYGQHLDWEEYTVHDASNVMRRFLNRLPQPLISLHYQALFKTTLGMYHSKMFLEAKVDAFQNLIARLPVAHQYLLLYLLDLLYLFSQCAQHTRMESSSLATVFSPVIFPDPAHATNPAGYKESQRVLEFLILHQDKFLLPNTLPNDVDKIVACPGWLTIALSHYFAIKHSVSKVENHEKTTAPSSSSVSLPPFIRQRRHSATIDSSSERPKGPYSLPYTSFSASDVFSFSKSMGSARMQPSPPVSTSFLKRSNTAPSSKRINSLEDRDSLPKLMLGQVSSSYTSRKFTRTQRKCFLLTPFSLTCDAVNQSSRNLGRWKSIKRVVKDEEDQQMSAPPLLST
ncbi:hypothetical protein [Parasitella parasitica]|uniref:Rho-GAP domain-containing protein n=1 Tax=Parasitella parasitica TaxID=35722 RepID=A0A0B7MWB1_9FUNG|nr:hypothetical protein [Parasitella parasitica]